MGTLDRLADVRVTRHICADTRLPWYRLCEDLPKLTAQDAERLIDLLRRDLKPDGSSDLRAAGRHGVRSRSARR